MLVDDLDEGPADETVSFAVDGASYEIDLSSRNATALRDALAPYVGAARKAGRSGGSRQSTSRPRSSGGGAKTGDVRAWARSQGLKVNERGRIPANIQQQYDAAH